MHRANDDSYQPRLLRLPYRSTATGDDREFFVYLPAGYDASPDYRWPMILFLHGGGERGDGRDDLDYVLLAGPLHEAWICQRDLPFVMISPQLPVFDQEWQVQLRAGVPRPVRGLAAPVQPTVVEQPDQPMRRAPDPSPPVFDVSEAWGDEGFPGGWQRCEDNLLRCSTRYSLAIAPTRRGCTSRG